MNRTTSSQTLNRPSWDGQLPSLKEAKRLVPGGVQHQVPAVKPGPGKAIRRAVIDAFKGMGNGFKSIGERVTKAHEARVAAREAKAEAKSAKAAAATAAAIAERKGERRSAILNKAASIRATRSKGKESVELSTIKETLETHLKSVDGGTVLRDNDGVSTDIKNYLAHLIPQGLDGGLLDKTDLDGPWPMIGQANKLDVTKVEPADMKRLMAATSALAAEIGSVVAQMPQEAKDLVKAVYERTKELKGEEVAKNAATGVLFLKYIVPAMFDVTTAMSSLPATDDETLQQKAVAIFGITMIQTVASGATEQTLRDKRVPEASKEAQDVYIDAAASLATQLNNIAHSVIQ